MICIPCFTKKKIRAKMAGYFHAILLEFAVNAFAHLSTLARPVKVCPRIRLVLLWPEKYQRFT